MGLRAKADAVMIGAGTLRVERYGRLVARSRAARSPRAATAFRPTRWRSW